MQQYKDLDLNFYLGTNISIVSLSKDSSIDYVSADIKLFPKNDERLKIKDIKLISKPEAISKLNEDASFLWKKPNSTFLTFGINSKVNVNNDFKKIRNKIKFPIESNDFRQYTEYTEFIDVNDQIIDTASKLVEGEDDLYFAVFKIAEWVRENIHYDLNTLTEKAVQKSTWVFENKQGVCDEMTNLFISMLRSVGIPARFVSGTVYTNVLGSWGNHGWAEVYFPEYGWLPFDVTFGQNGWVDATHLKLSDTPDSGEGSIFYNWLARDVDLDLKEVTVDTTLEKEGKKFDKLFDIKVSTLEGDKFGIGSYIPIEVSVTNLNNYYLGTAIQITKAPGLLSDNSRDVLLKPLETKSYYFMGRVQQNLSVFYKYSSILEAQEVFGQKDFYNLEIGNDYAIYDFNYVKDTIENLNKREKKEIFKDLELNCKPEKNMYYSDEEVNIKCAVKNKGSSLLNDLKICLKNKCQKTDLRIGSEEEHLFTTDAEKNILISAETDNLIKNNYVNLEIIEVPKIIILDINPNEINYNDQFELRFTLNSNVKINNASVMINKKFFSDLGDVSGNKEIILKLNGKDIAFNGLNLFVVYYDKIGNRYEKEFNFDVKVNSLPWYVRFIKIITFSN
ncbi:hypothetical protein HYX16_02385 [Candidatus Woesearchaeota archaeon]|nr:hypothetical protein [Candidatus Woesearchaeota archaeon]